MANTLRERLRRLLFTHAPSKHPTPKQHALTNVLAVANDVARQNPQALIEIVHLLGKKLQADSMARVLTDPHWSGPGVKPSTVLFNFFEPITTDHRSWRHLLERRPTGRHVVLATDVVLAAPWHPERMADALANIGFDRPWGAWRQDPNHRIEYWQPIGIAWVQGGNHSITSGIVHGTGTLTIDETYDISPLYDHLRCDGEHWIRTSDDRPLSYVEHVEVGAIFEVGRLMRAYGISA